MQCVDEKKKVKTVISQTRLSMKHILLYRSIAIILLKYRHSYSEKKYRSSPAVVYRCVVRLQP